MAAEIITIFSFLFYNKTVYYLFIFILLTFTSVYDAGWNELYKHFYWDILCYRCHNASPASLHAWLPHGSPWSGGIYCCVRKHCTGIPHCPGSTAPGQPWLGLQQKRHIINLAFACGIDCNGHCMHFCWDSIWNKYHTSIPQFSCGLTLRVPLC